MEQVGQSSVGTAAPGSYNWMLLTIRRVVSIADYVADLKMDIWG